MSTATRVQVKSVNGNNMVTGLRNQKPLKIMCPKTSGKLCHLITTNYGGGMVQGDEIRLEIEAGKDTCCLLGTQANTRVYKSTEGEGCKLIQETNIDESAVFIQLNDPLVLQKDSKLEQVLSYNLKKNAVLFLLDWVSMGRILSDEKFLFNKYQSECTIHYNEKLVVADRFLLEPDKTNCTSPAVFYKHNSYINIYLVGLQENEIVKHFESALDSEVNKLFQENKIAQPVILFSADRINEYVYMVRLSAVELTKLWDFVKLFANCFKSKNILGFNPYDRKY